MMFRQPCAAVAGIYLLKAVADRRWRISTEGKWHMLFRFQYSSVHEVTEPKADGGFGVDVVNRLIYYGASKALKLPAVYLHRYTVVVAVMVVVVVVTNRKRLLSRSVDSDLLVNPYFASPIPGVELTCCYFRPNNTFLLDDVLGIKMSK
jgi:hypothetical protein